MTIFEKMSHHKVRLVMAFKGLFLAATVGFIFLLSTPTIAQNIPVPPSSFNQPYDVSREQTLVGIVLTYTASSQSSPFGPHLTLQTPSGVVDVHLGDVRTLSANHFTIQPGDTLRIVGENVNLANNSAQFLARILQKGTQAIAVRTTHGFPIPATLPASAKNGKQQGGVM